MNANCLTPKPLGVIFITPDIIFFNTQRASLTLPRTDYNSVCALIAERISDRQIIVQQVRRYSRVLVCMYVCSMYVYMSAKNSGLSIVVQ